jgi:serine/threonine-protein kinase RsbT
MKPEAIAEATCVTVHGERDIVTARMHGRALALQMGFTDAMATLVATAISELARNMLLYARGGDIAISGVEEGERRGVRVEARDEGPGIADLARALEDGFSTSGRLGLGLPGVRRLTDDFQIRSRPGDGTVVTVIKWSR